MRLAYPTSFIALALFTGCPAPSESVDGSTDRDAATRSDGGTVSDGAVSGDGGPDIDAGPAPPGIAIEDYAAEMARANCRLLMGCCANATDRSSFTLGAQVHTEAECLEYFEAFWGSRTMSIQQYVDLGHTRWNEAAAGACVASIDASDCTDLPGAVQNTMLQYPGSDPICEEIAVGLRQAGEECGTFSCAEGFYCPNTGFPPHQCVVAPGVGGTCDDGICAGDLYCDESLETPTCFERLPNGAPCAPGSDGICESSHCSGGFCADFPPLAYCMDA